MEEAAAYQQLLDDFGATHGELAQRLGRSRSHITNTLRLLNLPPKVQTRVSARVLSAGHARALLAVEDRDFQDRSVEPTEYVSHLADVTRPEGTECTTFAECRDLLDDGEDIDYQGASGDIDFDDNGDPTSATFEVFHFGDDGYEILEYIDYTITE